MDLEQALSGIDDHLWSSEADVGEFLACLVRMHSFQAVIEVGTFKGRTACLLIDSLGSGGTYTGIDLEDHRPDSVRKYMEINGHNVLFGDSLVELEKLPNRSADLVFLDGDHTLEYVKSEFLISLRLLREGGLICIHDYHSRGVRIWVDFVRRFGHFETLVLNTSENRGMAVIAPMKGARSAGIFFRVWFALLRNRLALRILDKFRSFRA